MVRQFALNCVVKNFAHDVLTLVMDATVAERRTKMIDEKLTQGLARHVGREIRVVFETADAEVATRAIGLLRTQENLFKRRIPHAIVFMRTSPIIVTREEKEIRQNIEAAGVPRFASSLNDDGKTGRHRLHFLGEGDVVEFRIIALDQMNPRSGQIGQVRDLMTAECL